MMQFAEICGEIEKGKNNMVRLTELWNYIIARRNCYSDSHFGLMKELLNNSAKEIKKQEIKRQVREKYKDDD